MNTLSIVNVPAPVQADPIAAAVVRDRVEALLDEGLTIKGLHVATGIPEADLRAWRRGDAGAEIDMALAHYLADLQGAAGRDHPGFFETPTARRIISGLEDARSDPCIFVMQGGSGVGKSTVANWYLETTNKDSRRERVFYVSASQSVRTLSAILKALAQVVTGSGAHAYRTEDLFDVVAQRVGKGCLFMIDEAQHLQYEAIEGLRDFLDYSQVGLAFLGNEKTYKDFSGAGRAAKFAQLASRVGSRLVVLLPTEADVDVMLAAWGVKGRKEREFMLRFGLMDGGLRNVERIVRRAREIGGTELLHLKGAAKRIGLGVGQS